MRARHPGRDRCAASWLALAAGGFLYHHSQADGEAEAAVERGPDAVPVEVAAAEAGTLRERIEAVGTTLARQAVDIVALTSGRVAEIAFRPGERVEEGAVLVRLDDEAERAAVAEAEASLREAELALERAKKLRSNNTVAQATVDELQAAYTGASARVDGARKRLADRTVKAPFTGVVGMRRVDLGARVDDDTVLTTFDDLSEIEIEFSVPELFFGQVRPGQPVSRHEHGLPGPHLQRPDRDDRYPDRPDIARLSGPRRAAQSAICAARRHVHACRGRARGAARGADPGRGRAGGGRQTFVFTVRDGRAERRDGPAWPAPGGHGRGARGPRALRAGGARRRCSVCATGPRCASADQPADAAPRQEQDRGRMISDFCIKRPVFAAVLSLLIIVLGVASLLRLPIRELPDVDSAIVGVTTTYTRRRAGDRRHRHHRGDRGRGRRHRRRQDASPPRASAAAAAR